MDLRQRWVAIDLALVGAENPLALPVLDELAIADAVSMEMIRQDRGVIVVAIGIEFQFLSRGWLLYTVLKLLDERIAGRQIPPSDCIPDKEERTPLYAGEDRSFAFERVCIPAVFFALLFFI